MTTIPINNGNMQLPNIYAVYMYSPFPLIVTSATLTSVSLRVTCWDTTLYHIETRALHEGRAEFDLARIAQLLAPDVDNVFSMNTSQDGEAGPYVRLEFELETSDGSVLATREIVGLYGSHDQLEERFGFQRRRIWVNYPQTLQIWKDSSDEMFITGDYIDGDFYPALSLPFKAPDMTEMDFMHHLGEPGGLNLREALISGKTASIAVSCQFGGRDILSLRNFYDLKLVPDLSPRCAGTYLRWLHRDGTFGYWLFANGAMDTEAGLRNTFSRKIEGNPSEAVKGAYRNSVKADFTEVRRLTIGTRCETQDEYDYLCGLATSPVVDRLITVDGEDRWQRVNVVPGKYTRRIRYTTPQAQDFEISIELPERNTVTL